MGFFNWGNKKTPKSKWNLVLPEADRLVLQALFTQMAPGIEHVPFLQPFDKKYQDIARISSAETGLSARRVMFEGEMTVAILADDDFFNTASVLFLKTFGWSETQIAQFAFIHELTHTASWIARRNSMENGQNAVTGLWSGAFSAWPLMFSTDIPTFQIQEQCELLSACSPTGLIAQEVRSSKKAPHVAWASNLSELRADAIAVSFCACAVSDCLSTHPLHTNFSAELNHFSQSRAQNGTPSNYRWGDLEIALSNLDCFGSKTATQLNQLVAFSECAAYVCASGNMPFFLSAAPDSPFLPTLSAAFYGQHTKKASQQAQEGLALLKQCAAEIFQKTQPYSTGSKATTRSPPSGI